MSTRIAALVVVAGFACAVSATDRSGGTKGANFLRAHTIATGTGQTIGVIDLDEVRVDDLQGGIMVGGIIPQTSSLGARLTAQRSFRNVVPPVFPIPPAVPEPIKNDRHPTLTANIIAGGEHTRPAMGNMPARTFKGVAPNAKVVFGGVGPTHNSLRAAVDYLWNYDGVRVFNMSFGRGVVTSDTASGANDADAKFLDWYALQRGVLFVKSAGNQGTNAMDEETPGNGAGNNLITKFGDFYNGITVGASDRNGARVESSSYWLASDGADASDIRGKPDIMAPGDRVWDGRNYNETEGARGTSFAAPHVSGVAGLIDQLEGGGGLAAPVSKAIILNSARKRHIAGENAINGVSRDHANSGAQTSDVNYLNAGMFTMQDMDTPRTRDWTPSKWSYDGLVFETTHPLDDEQGTGIVDAMRAIRQYQAGEHEPGQVPTTGWSNNGFEQGSSDAKSYVFDRELTEGEFLTVTLAWNREIDEVDPNGATVGEVNPADTYDVYGLANMSLAVQLKNGAGAWNDYALSKSLLDNVEHLHIPIMADGEYRILVMPDAAFGRSSAYALAWLVPTPGGSLVLLAGGMMIAKRRR